jgi:hypothetical protein
MSGGWSIHHHQPLAVFSLAELGPYIQQYRQA